VTLQGLLEASTPEGIPIKDTGSIKDYGNFEYLEESHRFGGIFPSIFSAKE
jgi:hypothetical protein